MWIGHCKEIWKLTFQALALHGSKSIWRLMPEMSAFESFYGGQFTILSTQLIKSNCLVIFSQCSTTVSFLCMKLWAVIILFSSHNSLLDAQHLSCLDKTAILYESVSCWLDRRYLWQWNLMFFRLVLGYNKTLTWQERYFTVFLWQCSVLWCWETSRVKILNFMQGNLLGI